MEFWLLQSVAVTMTFRNISPNNRVNSDGIKRCSLSLTPLYAAGYAKRYAAQQVLQSIATIGMGAGAQDAGRVSTE